MSNPFVKTRILLGVTGSIAAYKAADLASKLAQNGALVDVILTQSALQFVTPLTFQSVTGRRAYIESDLWGSEGHIQHIGLARDAALMAIAPATANTLAKLAHGIADNLLSITALAVSCPIMVAPAMDGGMYGHPATQRNLAILRERGVILVGPAEGHLASGLSGIGRLIEPAEILGQIRYALSRRGPLKGRKLVVTAGGTQEPIDPVRAIVNRSSGKQGYAVAQAALDQGGEVTLISGPTHLAAPAGVELIEVITARDMSAAVLEAVAGADVLIMAAAVADFQPSDPASHKLKRQMGQLEIHLEATSDILEAVARTKSSSGFPRLVVGFAADSHDLLKNAREKLVRKDLDLLVANDITADGAGFAGDTNRVTILDAGGGEETLPLMTKTEVAEILIERVNGLLGIDR
jgi:phosphopantothenoylcysteine decarboxylase/phosphopantothenate--cysteine ligase